jgi:hypothetical protein
MAGGVIDGLRRPGCLPSARSRVSSAGQRVRLRNWAHVTCISAATALPQRSSN